MPNLDKTVFVLSRITCQAGTWWSELDWCEAASVAAFMEGGRLSSRSPCRVVAGTVAMFRVSQWGWAGSEAARRLARIRADASVLVAPIGKALEDDGFSVGNHPSLPRRRFGGCRVARGSRVWASVAITHATDVTVDATTAGGGFIGSFPVALTWMLAITLPPPRFVKLKCPRPMF